MKKVLLMAFAAVGIMMMAGCGDKINDKADIYGKWNVTPLESYLYSIYEGDTVKAPLTATMTMTFNHGGQLIIEKGGESDTHTWGLSDNGLHLTIDGNEGKVLQLDEKILVFYIEKDVEDDGISFRMGEHYSLTRAQ